MSGPVEERDRACEDEALARVEAREGRASSVVGLDVVRVLPTKGRRTVGAWCFVDLMGPVDAEEPDPMEVGPHPHIGLATVTWLLEGEALHSDSLGTEQVIRPGELNLMHAGHGIAHAELAAEPPFRGVQMWLAQPEATRHGQHGFEHHGELPRVAFGDTDAHVFVGQPRRCHVSRLGPTPVWSAPSWTCVAARPSCPVERGFEHAVVPLDGRVRVGPEVVEPGWVALVPAGVEVLPVEAAEDGGRAMLLGGEPLGEPIQMWWNFVARERDEIDDAYRAWRDHDTDRFGPVPSGLERIDAPVPPWLREG